MPSSVKLDPPAWTRRARAEPANVPAVRKAIQILRHLNAVTDHAAGPTEVAAALGISKSHCFNILRALEAEGWVRYDDHRRRHQLSARLLTDVSCLLSHGARAEAVRTELRLLSQVTRLPCVLTRVEPDGTFTAIEKAEDAAELLVSVPLGHRFPADAPAQMRARLAFAAEEERERALTAWRPVAYTATTITDRAVLERELLATRIRGFAISRAEFTAGVTTLAAPVMNAQAEVSHVLQCPGLEADVPMRQEEVAAPLIRTAGLIGPLLDMEIS